MKREPFRPFGCNDSPFFLLSQACIIFYLFYYPDFQNALDLV